MVRSGDAAVEVLAGAGARRFYTVPGESFLEIMDAVESRPDLSLISTRHESGASFMAEADAKLTGVPAVAMATRGVGASNLAIGVHTAKQDSTPMVVLLGQVETPFLGREAFQEVDLPDFYRQITKYSATVHTPDRLPEFVEKALRIATSGRPGPVMLALPADILGKGIEAPDGKFVLPKSRPAPSAEDVREASRRIAEARRPVIIAGEGAKGARGELVAFAERYGVGVYTAFRRQDKFPNEHTNYLGHLALGTVPEIMEALEGADLVVSVGCRLDEVTTQSYRFPKKGQSVIQIGAEAVASTMGFGLAADVGNALSALIEAAPKGLPERDWSAAHGAYLKSSEVPESRSDGGIDPAEVIAAMKRTLPESSIITNDAGNFSVFLHRYWRYNHPETQLAPANGAMGYGVPAAIGAKLAAPEREVVAVSGDGGFLMTGQEIETAVRYGLSLTIIVMRNGMHGTIAMHQAREMGRTAGTDISGVDPASFARSLGAEGISVKEPGEIIPALEAAFASDAVSLVDIATDPDLITPTARLSEMTGNS